MNSATFEQGVATPSGVQIAQDAQDDVAGRRLIDVGAMLPMMDGGPDQLSGGCRTRREGIELAVDCDGANPSSGGMYVQFVAADFLGERIRFSALLKADDFVDIGGVESVASVWIRIDGGDSPVVDNGRTMGVRATTTDWVSRDLALEVPETASIVSVGVWMQGRGHLRTRDLLLETL